jgi:hypothetical protein
MANVFDNSKNLPHYNARKEAGIGKEEPVYANMWVATIIPPAGVGNGELLSAQVTAFSGVNTNPATTPVEQIYRGATRSFANGKLDTTVVDISMNFNLNLNDANKLYVYQILRAWKKRVHDPQTGRRGKKKDYVGQIIIEYHNREGEIFKRDVYLDCFIHSALPELAGDYSSGDLLNMEGIVFRSDSWSEDLGD